MAKSKKALKKILPFLQVLKDIKPVQRKILLAHLDDQSLNNICEATSNVLHNPNLTSKQKTRLRRYLNPHKSSIRYLSRKKTTVKNKKKKLFEIGGNPLAFILSAAIPLLIDAIS